ncbi:hypothetical protein Q1695_002279 [Nippostrongylus brasiliensis]|nr:hypothetical protein Q1695_002279 [Nippostrongylus brasiliensis]
MPVLPMDIFSKRSLFSFQEQNVIETILSLEPSSYYCTVNGEIVHDFSERISEFPKNDFFQLHFRLLGGKGGFGSLLRSFRVNKSTNQLMCRDLNGRRLASIDEEERLKKWIERCAEREREKIAKRNAKYEKLKSGPPKHMFNDPDYIRQKEEIIEKTEEAFETGFEEFIKAEKEKKETVVESSSDSDFDIDDLPGASKAGRKRKAAQRPAPTPEKKQKVEDEEDDSSSDSEENDVDPELLREIQNYFANKTGECSTSNGDGVCGSTESEKAEIPPKDSTTSFDGASGSGEKPMVETSSKGESKVSTPVMPAPAQNENPPDVQKPAQQVEFAPIDLSRYDNASQLEVLGLDHLKHELKSRGMKCGGTLRDRAVRLFSAKEENGSKKP